MLRPSSGKCFTKTVFLRRNVRCKDVYENCFTNVKAIVWKMFSQNILKHITPIFRNDFAKTLFLRNSILFFKRDKNVIRNILPNRRVIVSAKHFIETFRKCSAKTVFLRKSLWLLKRNKNVIQNIL